MSHLPSAPNASLLDAYKRQPEMARHLHEFAETLMRGSSPLSAEQRERIAVRVSRRNGCTFCEQAHEEAAARLSDAPDRSSGKHDPPPSSHDDPMRPVLAFADRLTDDPGSISQQDIDAILDAGWDETAVEHAVLVCGFFSLMNRWVEGLGIQTDAETVRMAGKMLHEQGYRAIARAVLPR